MSDSTIPMRVGGVLALYFTSVYFIALLKKRNDLADVAWGPGFLVGAWGAWSFADGSSWRSSLIFGMIALWALRLSLYIGLRNKGKEEDFRYQAWRKEWGKNAWWRSYLQVFLLQGAILFVVGLPVWLGVSSRSDSQPSLVWSDALGVLIWLTGLGFETVADAQMAAFRRAKAQEKVGGSRVMRTGLWRYSRHPNYFGEALLWWGVFVVCLSATVPFWTGVGPALMTFLLVKVSGVPMLEKKYAQDPEYQEYQRTTPVFVPWFPKT